MKLTCSPAGWREVAVELQPTGLPDAPWGLHVYCDAGNNFDFTLDELRFIGAATLKLADVAEANGPGETTRRVRLEIERWEGKP